MSKGYLFNAFCVMKLENFVFFARCSLYLSYDTTRAFFPWKDPCVSSTELLEIVDDMTP